MRSQYALRKSHQRTGEDVGTFHRDCDRQSLVRPEQVVGRPVLDGPPTLDVEGVVHAVAHGFGSGVFEQARNHRRPLPLIDHRRGQPPPGLIGVGALNHFAERLGNAFHQPHRNAELPADAGVGRSGAQGLLDRDRSDRRQRDGAPSGQALHQHAPALAGIGGATDQIVDGNENVPSAHRPVHEGLARRVVTAADVETRMGVRDQRQRNADILAAPQQIVRILEDEGEPDQRRDRCERDVALVEAEPHAQRLLAFPGALGQHADVAHAAGIGARMHACQGEAGHVLARGQAVEVFVFLFGRSVFFEQFARSE